MECMICGTNENVTSDIFNKSDGTMDRIYSFCPIHWAVAYKTIIGKLFEDNPYKVASFIKQNLDEVVMDSMNGRMVENNDVESLNIENIFEIKEME